MKGTRRKRIAILFTLLLLLMVQTAAAMADAQEQEEPFSAPVLMEAPDAPPDTGAPDIVTPCVVFAALLCVCAASAHCGKCRE